MKINKILSVILAVAMILGTMTTLAFAEESAAVVETTPAVTVANVEVTDAEGNVTYYEGFTGFSEFELADCVIKLLADVSDANLILNKGTAIDTNVKLDLNGFTFSREGSSSGAISLLQGSQLTICDTSDEKNGKIISDTYAVWIMNGDLWVESGTIETTSTDEVAIYVNAAEVEINGGNIISAGDAISVGENFIESKGASTISISDGVITAGNCGIVEGSYSGANTALTISGGEINSTDECIAMEKGTASITGGTFSADVPDEYLPGGFEIEKNEDGTYGVINTNTAKIGDVYYKTFAEAIEAAKAISNPVITIFAGTYDAFEVPAELNNVKFIGETDTNGNNLVTIKTLEEGITTHTGGIFVRAEKATFKNLDITSGDVSALVDKHAWMTSAMGRTNGTTGAESASNLKTLIVENCNFTGSGVYQAIWARLCDVTLTNCKISGYDIGVENYNYESNQKVICNNCEISNVGNAFHSGPAAAGELIVDNSVIDAEAIHVSGVVKVNITNSTIKNADITAFRGVTVDISNSKLYDTTYAMADNATGTITLNKNFANNVDTIIASADANSGIIYTTYYPTEKDFDAKTNLTNADKTSGIAVTFVKDTEDSTGRTYKIVLKAEEGSINDFESAHFTFVNKGDLDYVITPNTAANITAVDDITNENRISFYMNADENKPVEISGNEIILGTVAFGGYGDADFSIDEKDAKVNATTVVDSIVETFTPDSTTNKLYVNWTDADTTDEFLPYINVEDLFVEQARDLNVVINFNNDITSQSADYTEMKVEVTGQNGEKHLGLVGDEPSVKYDAEMVCATVATDGKTVTLPFTVTAGYRYTVKVEGAGYRTAEYTTVIPVLTPEEYATDEGITLTFWNNVKDEFNKTEIESGSDRWYTKNFLAGEIVQDNKINKYDLAAVVSYFGEDKLVENRPEYNKYDLNRDGVIDSEDIAYVLVSFGE